jgi:sorbose reductase
MCHNVRFVSVPSPLHLTHLLLLLETILTAILHQACYNATKAAVIHLAKSLAVEWAPFARVNSVSPGYIKTPISAGCSREMKDEWFSLTPMRREADAKELKGVYLYLASDASTFTTGADIIVDGGYCCR